MDEKGGGTPGLKPHERCNPSAYVTERDFRGWTPGLVQANRGELEQWRKRDALSATALAIAAFICSFRGLRGGRDGCGVQMTLEGWAELLGVSTRMVCYAFEDLAAAGWVWRRRRLVQLEWVDKNGKQWQRADVWGVAYLSKLGAVRLARRGETRRLVVRDGKSHRVLQACGLGARLLKEQAREIRAIALRVTDAQSRFTPSFGEQRELRKPVDGTPPHGGAAVSGPATGPPSRSSGPKKPDAGAGGECGRWSRARELERLRNVRAWTPAQAWPDQWFAGDDVRRRWLAREFEAHRPELVRYLMATTNEAEQLEQNARVVADLARTRAIEAQQPTQAQRLRNEALYAAGGRGRGGRLGELRKLQAAMRAAGELPPKRKCRKGPSAGRQGRSSAASRPQAR